MAKLLFQAGSNPEILLKPGRNRIGRNAENDIQISDPSVSSFHCEANLQGDTLQIVDLGSTNGTCVDARPATEAVLHHGQILRLGTVELRFENEPGVLPTSAPAPVAPPPGRIRIAAPAAPPAAPPVAPELGDLAGGPDDCVRHPGTLAGFVCQKCGRLLCPACIKTHHAGSSKLLTCIVCDGHCLSRTDYAKAEAFKKRTFFGSLPSVFSYPLKGNGLILLFGGTIFYTLLNVATAIIRFGLISLGLTVMSVGYLVAYMQSIVTATINHEDEMPTWPDVSNYYDDLLVPFLRFIAICAIFLGPGILAERLVSPELGNILQLLGLFVLPMGLLTVSVADSLSGLNPVIIVTSICKIPGAYLIACGTLFVVVMLEAGIDYVLKSLGMPLVTSGIQTLVGLYGFSVEMRILGLLYSTNERKLAWFDR